ncbi:MAG: cytochrome c oxidase assembly protein, partial [Sulfobacillus sp.]|nr:cytochrome c oxidase assembly protein [Sulfobacillus sp.]
IADTTKPFYAFYEQAPHVFGLGALADQQTGALLMGVAMFLAYAIAFGAAFRRYDFSSWYA